MMANRDDVIFSRRAHVTWTLLIASVAALPVLVFVIAPPLVVGLISLSCVAFLLSVRPVYRLYCLVALLPFSHVGIGWSALPGFGPFDIYCAWSVIVFVTGTCLNYDRLTRLPVAVAMGVLVCGGCIPATMNAPFLASTVKAFVEFVQSLLLMGAVYAIVRQRSSDEFHKHVLSFWVISTIAVSIWGIVEGYLTSSFIRVIYGRAYFSLFQEVNYYASYLLMVIPFCIGFFALAKHRVIRLWSLVALVILSVAVVSTVSRSGIAALGLLLVTISVMFLLKGGRIASAGGLIIGVLGIAIVVAIFTGIAGTAVDLLTLTRRVNSLLSGGDASLDQRGSILGVAIEMFKRHPIVGVGFGSFEDVFDTYKGPLLSTGFARSAHNTPLRVLAETGLVGFTLFILLILSIFIPLGRAVRNYRTDSEFILTSCYLFSTGVFAFMSLFLDQLFEPHFWLVCGLGLAYAHELRIRYTRPVGRYE